MNTNSQFQHENKDYTYIIHRTTASHESPPIPGIPEKKPRVLTDEWIAGEMSKAHNEDMEKLESARRNGMDETRASVLEDAILNVQGFSKDTDLFIVFNSEDIMVGKVAIHVEPATYIINMLFLHGFSRTPGSVGIMFAGVANYSKTFPGKWSLMPINPLSTIYKRLLSYGCRCFLLTEGYNVGIDNTNPSIVLGGDFLGVDKQIKDAMAIETDESMINLCNIDGYISREETDGFPIIGFGAIIDAASIIRA